MIIVNLKGGLGNQMFQYAAARRLSELRNEELKFDLSFLEVFQKRVNVTIRQYELSILNIKESFATPYEVKKWVNWKNKLLRKGLPNFRFNPYVKEKNFQFDSSILELTGSCYLDGHWMSEKYFSDIEPIIRKEFTFKREILAEGRSLHSKILSTNSICIQVRRGDYITNPEIAKIHQTTSIDYFTNAISVMKTKVDNPVFFVFSDDSQWCVENFRDLGNMHFIEKELATQGAGNTDYLQLMISCSHFIISNSTFAWWGAWLSPFKNKIVIAPRNWFNDKAVITADIYPPSWIKI